MTTARLTRKYINQLPTTGRAYWVDDALMPGLRLYVGATGVKSYYVAYRVTAGRNGRKDSYRLGDERQYTPQQARQAAQHILADMTVTGEDIKQRRRNTAPTVRELVTAYRMAGRSEYTCSMVERMDIIDDTVDTITVMAIERWRIRERQRTGNKYVTLNRKVEALKSVLTYAVQHQLIEANPLAQVGKLRETDSEPKTRYLTDDERKRLLRALDDYDNMCRTKRANTRAHAKGQHCADTSTWTYANYLKPLVIVALNTGIRRHALLTLQWGDVDLEHDIITLRASTAKSGRTAILPINDTVHNTLAAWHQQRQDNNPYIWPSPHSGEPMHDCDTAFARVLHMADIHNFRWHDMRHDFASRLVSAGVDLNTVRELMTHSDISMTLRYAHLAPNIIRSAVQKLDK